MERRKFIRVTSKGALISLLAPSFSVANDDWSLQIPFPRKKKEAVFLRGKGDYSLMWWKEGIQPGKQIFNIQTGRYGLSFDFANLTLRKLGRLQRLFGAEEAMQQDNSVIESLPDVLLEAFVDQRGRRYRLKSSKDYTDCQLIESGVYFQRRWMPGLSLSRDERVGLPSDERTGFAADEIESGLELSAWPEQCILSLRVKPSLAWKDTGIGLKMDFSDDYQLHELTDGAVACRDMNGKGFIVTPVGHAEIDIQGSQLAIRLYKDSWVQEEVETIGLNFYAIGDPGLNDSLVRLQKTPLDLTKTSVEIKAEQVYPQKQGLDIQYDAFCNWYCIVLPADTRDLTKRDPSPSARVMMTIKNPAPYSRIVHLNFSQEKGEGKIAGITGIIGIIRDNMGYPTGMPVQISKNWHIDPGRFKGTWHRGILMINVPADQKISFEYTTLTSYWGLLPAASIAQLCLVGWGYNQLWIQSAVGAWGESITLQPYHIHGRGMILDSRPLAVWGMGDNPSRKWGWTHNVGGADFLVYYDEQGRQRKSYNTKTYFKKYGPLFSEVRISSETDDRKIGKEYTFCLYGTDDYIRGICRFRIAIREMVRFTRFVIFQCGGDKYNFSAEKKFAAGNKAGLIKEWEAQWGGNTYRTKPIELSGENPWISMHEAEREAVRPIEGEGAWANRGVVVREWNAVIGGRSVKPHVAERGLDFLGSETSQADFVLPENIQQLNEGDYIEGVMEYIIMPQYAGDYFGFNKNFAQALQQSENTWKMIHREANLNNPSVNVREGVLLSSWPIVIRVESEIAAEIKTLYFDITGGLAYVPVTIKGLPSHEGFVLEECRDKRWKKIDLSVLGNDFWQTDYEANSKEWEVTYSLYMDQPDNHVPLRKHARKFRFQSLFCSK